MRGERWLPQPVRTSGACWIFVQAKIGQIEIDKVADSTIQVPGAFNALVGRMIATRSSG